MNDKVISFITAVNNEEYYEKCLQYLQELVIPEGYTIEIVTVRNGYSICSAYNAGMNKASGKYKVYVHQDVGILNKNFILDILDIFEDETIGMIGMVGTTSLDTSVIWWNVRQALVGKAYHFAWPHPIFENPVDKVRDVASSDGLLLATQYDIPWREDILKSWHLYDTAQSLEFQRKGKRVVVPRQEEPWCVHGFDGRTANMAGYDEARIAVFNNYYDMLPRNV